MKLAVSRARRFVLARLARRTPVLQRREGRWLVAHLRASNVPRP
jgi:hypothetical protein